MCGWFHINKTHVNHANLIMRYLSIRRSDLEIVQNQVSTTHLKNEEGKGKNMEF